MTHTPAPPALTVRDMPAYLDACDHCGATPALPVPGSPEFRCAPCHSRDVLSDGAREQLRELVAPLLGVWAAHWDAAGLTPEHLAGLLEEESAGWMTRAAGQNFQRVAVRYLRRKYRPAPYTDAVPERLTVRLEQLPTVNASLPPCPARGMDWPHLGTRNADGSAGTYRDTPGLDLLTVELPDGSAVLIPLGYRGTLDADELRHATRFPGAFRAFLPDVTGPAQVPE